MASRLGGKAHIISSQVNELEWTLRIRFESMRKMRERVGASLERECMLCHHVMSVLMNTVVVSGHPNIQDAFVRKIDLVDAEPEYVIETQGCALLDFAVAPCIDWCASVSNDVSQVIALLGIEAAVVVLFNELFSTISFDGTYVDPRHIMMIVNTMTHRGYMMPLSRHGINRMDTGPMLRCSFEETPDILCDAACFAERDNGKGVSNNIMTGQLASIGSGCSDVKMDATCADPRSLHLAPVTRCGIAKSKVRRSAPTECMQSQECAFDVDMPSAPLASEARDPIFANDQCDKPYKNEEDTDLPMYEIAAVGRHDYRPSSPMSEDDM